MKRLSRSGGWTGESRVWRGRGLHAGLQVNVRRTLQSRARPSLLQNCTGTEVALGPQVEECTRLRLHHISASLRTEAQGTRKSSEAAHGVFSGIREFFFLPVSGSSAHLNWSAKYTWGNEQMYAHVCTRTCLLHVTAFLFINTICKWAPQQDERVLLDWKVSPQWSRYKGSCHHVHTWFESLDKIRREWFWKRRKKNWEQIPHNLLHKMSFLKACLWPFWMPTVLVPSHQKTEACVSCSVLSLHAC